MCLHETGSPTLAKERQVGCMRKLKQRRQPLEGLKGEVLLPGPLAKVGVGAQRELE